MKIDVPRDATSLESSPTPETPKRANGEFVHAEKQTISHHVTQELHKQFNEMYVDPDPECDYSPHNEILNELMDQVGPVDFKSRSFKDYVRLLEELKTVEPESDEGKALIKTLDGKKLGRKHYLVLSIEVLLQIAKGNKWDLCKNLSFIYLYNGAYWAYIDKDVFQKFLGEASEKMGVEMFDAKHYQFREQLFKQFLATAILPKPEPPSDIVLINLKGGTFEITSKGTRLKRFDSEDFLTYQLPFEYDNKADAPLFQKYLDRVLPDKECQNVLAEYLGYLFIRNGSKALKEEKALILYGSGANGKSVFFEIVNALLGKENVSSFSLQALTDENGYYRAMIANRLVNYASEINGKVEASLFKQLVSGEPVGARLPYGEPITLTQYAKMIFNCNELPREVEHTKAYFRRFLIIPFVVTIPESEQDKQLHSKIIDGELSGVFNWVLSGLSRLLAQKRFSECEAAKRATEQYEIQSDTVKLFIEENGYKGHSSRYMPLKEIYVEYRSFCLDDGFRPLNKSNFKKRLEDAGCLIEKKNTGNVVYLSKQDPF